MHGPWAASELGDFRNLFGCSHGWLVDVLYSTDLTWNTDSKWSSAVTAGYTVVLRLDYAREPNGATIPPSGTVSQCLTGADNTQATGTTHLACYLDGVTKAVKAQSAVHAWIIGNEANLTSEAGLFAQNEIPPAYFADVYIQARAQIRQIPGHADDVVLIGGVSPGDIVPGVRYMAGNDFLTQMLQEIKTKNEALDGVALHAYGGSPTDPSHGITSFQNDPKGGWQAQAGIIHQQGFDCSMVLISEVNATRDLNNPTDPTVATGGAAFVAAAVDGIKSWNTSANLPLVSGAVWYRWDPSDANEAQFSMKYWWTLAQTQTTPPQDASNNWARSFQHAAPDHDAAFDGISCPPPPGPINQSVTVPGNNNGGGWSNTGILVHAQQTVTFSSCSGTIQSWPGSTPWTCQGDVTTWSQSVAPSCNEFTLISRIDDDGAPQCYLVPAGASSPSFVAPASGCLWLGFNDGVNFNDNSGQWMVQVGVK
jgi:hypothetical protein